MAPVLLWADDPIELFFLQVQGSGRVQLPDGRTVRIGYADQNGHPYQSIGRWLVAQGELPLEKASMDGIKAWAEANPERLHELLNANPSYVFFRELPASSGGPVGALGVPLSVEEIWREYVVGALHGVSTAVFSSAFVVQTERGDANFLSMARGACALCHEHGSLDLMMKG